MDAEALRQILREEMEASLGQVREEMKAEFAQVREEIKAEFGHVREEIKAEFGHVREEIKASEDRMIQSSQMQFRQMGELYRGMLNRIDGFEKLVEGQLGQVRGSIESLKASLEAQNFRADQLGRRITALETQPKEA